MERGGGSREELSRQQAILAGIPYIVTKQFPWRLHEMLEQSEREGYEHIVSWVSGGRAFKVHRPDTFVKDIMKQHFQQTKYKSFQRQLNLWGFERSTKEAFERGSYYHPLFIRGRKELCQNMERHRVKQSVSAASIASTGADEKPPSLTSSSEATSQSGSVESDNKPSPPSSSPNESTPSMNSSQTLSRSSSGANGASNGMSTASIQGSPRGPLHQALQLNNMTNMPTMNMNNAVPAPAPSNPSIVGAYELNQAMLLLSAGRAALPAVRPTPQVNSLPIQFPNIPATGTTQANQVQVTLDALLASVLASQQRFNGNGNGNSHSNNGRQG